jgi:hypothetical protein
MANSLRVIFGIFGVILFLTEIVPAAAYFRAGAELEAEHKQQETEYKKAVEADPENAEAHYNLGSVTSNLTSRIDELSRAIDLKPGYWLAYLARGHAYERDGQPGKAIQDFTTVITLLPNQPEAYIARAQVYRTRPFSSLWAIWDVDKAIEIDKNYPGADDLRVEIKRDSWLPPLAWHLLGIKDPIEKRITGEQRIKKEFEETSKTFEDPVLGMTGPVEEMMTDQRISKMRKMFTGSPEKQPTVLRMKEATAPVEEMTIKPPEEINKVLSPLGVELLDKSEFDKLNVDRSRK